MGYEERQINLEFPAPCENTALAGPASIMKTSFSRATEEPLSALRLPAGPGVWELQATARGLWRVQFIGDFARNEIKGMCSQEEEIELLSETSMSSEDLKGEHSRTRQADSWLPYSGFGAQGEPWQRAKTFLGQAAAQLQSYLAGCRRRFAVPLDLTGYTDFQRTVLQACQNIPYGQTLSYGELARRCGAPKAARAVGQVLAANRLLIFIPCHRVVGCRGELTGFGGGLDLKRWLLAHEQGEMSQAPKNVFSIAHDSSPQE